MKKLTALLLAVCICASLAGCSLLDYKEARELYDAGKYAEALEIYRSLGDYADSADMAEICWQKADYEAAEKLYAAGDYAGALPLYTGLTMYMDSPMKVIRCKYEIGLGYLEAGDYAEAIAWLEPLGSYEQSADMTHLARWRWLRQARNTIVFSDEPDNFRAISLEPYGEESVRILLENRALLLGLPYEVRFEMTFERGGGAATYEVTYSSTSGTTIEETASGVFDLAALVPGFVPPVESFTQTVINEAGEETVSSEGADAIMIRSIMADAVNQILENLPALVEKTGADITLTQMGFTE